MNNELINFHHEMFGDIRAIEKDGESWFVGKDVAETLGYNNTRDALYKHVDEEDKIDGVAFRDTIGREQKMTIIRVGPLLPRSLLEAPFCKAVQALGHRRGAALHPPPRGLCHGTDDREDHRITGVRHRTAEEYPGYREKRGTVARGKGRGCGAGILQT